MKAFLQLLPLVFCGCALSASAIVAQPEPTASSQPSRQNSEKLTQQDKAVEDKLYRITREEVDRLKRDNKEQVELYIQNKVNERFATSIGYISLIGSLIAVVFGSTAGLVLAAKWKKEFKEEYMHKTGDDIEKTRKTIINLQKETVALLVSWVLPTYSTLSFEESITSEQEEQFRDLAKTLSMLIIPKSCTEKDFVTLGKIFYYGRQYEKALNAYEKAVETDPNSSDAWLGKGKALRWLEKYDDAIAAHEKVLKIDDKYYSAWVEKGAALRRKKQYEDAINACEKAIEIKPDYARAWYNKACYFALLDKTELAIKSLREAVELTSSDGRYRNMAQKDSDFKLIRSDEQFQQSLRN